MNLKIINKSMYELPRYETEGSAGFDLRANIDKPLRIFHHSMTGFIPTGLFMKIEPGYEGEIRPRSGLAFKHGITLINSPGTIDSDYRGEIMVCLVNHSEEDYILEPGERIAQMLIKPVVKAEIVEVDELDDTTRGVGGFGSTGKN